MKKLNYLIILNFYAIQGFETNNQKNKNVFPFDYIFNDAIKIFVLGLNIEDFARPCSCIIL